MPGVTPIRPDDVHSARAWAAFVADDAAATAPPSLEARVLRTAQAALAQRQRAEAERRRRQWFAGLTAIAASLLAAAAWSLAPREPTREAARVPAPQPAASPLLAAATAGSVAPMPDPAATRSDTDSTSAPMPMTNVEAGRLLSTPPQARLAARPLFEATDGGAVRAPGALRARSFGAPIVEPVAIAHGHAAPVRATPPAGRDVVAPIPLAPAALAGTAPEAWTTRGAKPVFDPEGAEIPPPPPVFRLDQSTPAAVPPAREEPPAPPK